MSPPSAIITGAASGIGLALTKALLAKGYHVVMADINPEGSSLAASLGNSALFIQTDTSDWGSQLNLFQKAFSWTTPTTLFANAGITGTDPSFLQSLTSTTSSNPPQKPLLPTIAVNLLGTIYSIQLFASFFLAYHFPKQTSASNGSIILTASQASIYALPLDPIYASTKAALVALTRSLVPNLTPNNLTINAILPGLVPTAITSPLLPITPTPYITPLSTIVQAATGLMEGKQTGQTVECSGTELFHRTPQEYPNEVARWVWEDAPGLWAKVWVESQQV